MCDNLDEPQNHHAKWKKPITTTHILHDPFNMKYPEYANPSEIGMKLVAARDQGGVLLVEWE